MEVKGISRMDYRGYFVILVTERLIGKRKANIFAFFGFCTQFKTQVRYFLLLFWNEPFHIYMKEQFNDIKLREFIISKIMSLENSKLEVNSCL
jgi:hypothetical protein